MHKLWETHACIAFYLASCLCTSTYRGN